MPIGRRIYWPVFEAAARAGLPVCLHAGGLYRQAPMGNGWPSYFVEDYVTQSTGFEGALVSLLAEGVFQKFPDLTFVLAETGATWLPPFLWRQDKMWLGVRTELPWIDRIPREIICERVRLTLQPFDAPSDPTLVGRVLDHFGTDEILLFSTDYPHWPFRRRGRHSGRLFAGTHPQDRDRQSLRHLSPNSEAAHRNPRCIGAFRMNQDPP